MAENRADEILLELKRSFLDDKRDIQEQIVEIETKIKESKAFIESLSKKDECDYNMFSPRSASRVYKDQIYEKQLDIESKEEILRTLYRKLSSIIKKIDMVNELSPDSFSIDKNVGSPENKSIYLKLQEDDRQRIASDLHDTVLQNLALVMHNLELASKFIDYDAIRTKLELETNRKLVRDTIEEIRSTIFDLRPMQFDDFGFKKSLENQIEAYRSRCNMNISYYIDDIDKYDRLILLTLFRIVQELVINAIKHSGGKEINIQIHDEETKIFLDVSDDGMGMEPGAFNKTNHFGLKILKERVDLINGTLTFPIVEKGFKAVIEIPV